MLLSEGEKLGPYEILALIGEGGMGEVYKARDPRLGRDVAIKVLPAAMMSNPIRKQRFVQEARAASALNHPNIVTVYDVSKEGGIDFLVMEYVKGQTLERLIPRNGMRLSEALRCGIQITDALAKAHAIGIVHRDLKPGNIIVTEEGVVKILDFGLAKTMGPVSLTVDDATLAEGQAGVSREGQIVGTPAYMSPEQAEGKTVDARTDIFSFGSLFYEMITARAPFRGDSLAATMAAVIKDEPKPPHQIVEGLPRDVERIILRCLRKDPARRFQHIADVKVELQECHEESQSGTVPSVVHPKRKRWWMAAVATVALLSGGYWVFRASRVEPVGPMTVKPVTTFVGYEDSPTFSPDGTQVAFRWDGEKRNNSDIYVMVVGEQRPLRLTTAAEADTFPAWSPDGKQIGFVRSASGVQSLYVISPLGGTERKIGEYSGAAGGLSWSPDSKWLAIGTWSQSILVPVEGGNVVVLREPKPPETIRSPKFSPDGRMMAFFLCPSRFSCDVWVEGVTPEYQLKGDPRRLTQQRLYLPSGLAWISNGKGVVYSGGQNFYDSGELWRISLDGRDPPARLALASAMGVHPAFDRSGHHLAFSRSFGHNRHVSRASLSDGTVTKIIESSHTDENAQFSPDGTKITFVSGRSGMPQIWLANADHSQPMQLTSGPGAYQGWPRWSPDGKWIVFASMGSDNTDIYKIASTGGKPVRLTDFPGDEARPHFSRDGEWIFFASDKTGRRDVWRMPSGGGLAKQITYSGAENSTESADGSELFYMKGENGPLYARRHDNGKERKLLEWVTQVAFAVVPDGIYYFNDNRLLFHDFARGKDELLLERPAVRFGHGLSVSPDRKWVIWSETNEAPGSDIMMIENFR